jgi:aldehyde dehydrogenase (NAD+)
VSNLKQTWVGYGRPFDFQRADLRELLRHATQIKNIWVPYGA